MKHFRSALTYANVVSSLALFVALGGVGYAAATLPRNSVGSAQLRKEAVSTSKLRKNAVTGSRVRNGTLTGADIKDGSLTARDFAASSQPAAGPPGPKGDAGPRGETGTIDTSGFYDKKESDARFLGLGARAADANRLEGRDAAGFLATAGTFTHVPGFVDINGCGSATLATTTVTLTRPSRVLVIGHVNGVVDSGTHSVQIVTTLLDGATVLASTPGAGTRGSSNTLSITDTALLLSEQKIHVAPAGTYTLRMTGANYGACAGAVQYQGIRLSWVALPA